MASTLNEANLEKKLHGVTNTQESIQTLSLWCMHHKAHYKKIVETWLRVIKKTKSSRRLALFYLANDVIQNSKRKNNTTFQDAWNLVLKDAVPFVRDDEIRSQIERIFSVWETRNVYDSEYIEELKAILGKPNENKGTVKSRTANAKLLAEFKPQKLVDKIRRVKKLQSESELKHKHLTSMKIDVSSTETLRQLKDRAHGDRFSQEFEDGTVKLNEYVRFLEQEVEERAGLIEILEKAEVFYDTQRGEAKIVANAYKNFGSRVKNLKKRLDEMMSSLPSPIPSPTPDAPSPVDSSVGGSPDVHDANKDNTEAVDMEMSDEETEGCTLRLEDPDVGSPGSAPSPEGSPVGLNLPPSPPMPSKRKETVVPPSTQGSNMMSSLLDSVSVTSKNTMSLDSRLSNLMQNIPNLSPAMHSGLFDDQSGLIPLPQSVISSAISDVISGANEAGGGTPLKDEGSATGSATPLQDEEREASNPVKLLNRILLSRVGGAIARDGPPLGSRSRDDAPRVAWDKSRDANVQVDQNSKPSPTKNENMSISEFFKKIGSTLAGTQSPGGTKREWNFPKSSQPQPKRSLNAAPFQTSNPDWFPKSSSMAYDSSAGVTSHNDSSQPAAGSNLTHVQESPDMAPSLIPSQLAERKPPGNAAKGEPYGFRNEVDSLASIGEPDRSNSLDSDGLQGFSVGGRQRSILELTPAPVRTGGGYGKGDEVRVSSNLITLVQSVDDTAVTSAAAGAAIGQYGAGSFDFQPTFRTELMPAAAAAAVDGDKVQQNSQVLNDLSAFPEENTLPDPLNEHHGRPDYPGGAVLNSTVVTLTGGEETTYSRIETVTRRDSDKRRFGNDGDMYHRRYDAHERRPEWDKYPPQNHGGFQRPWMPKENRGGFKSFPPRPRFGPPVINRYPPPPHPDGRRPFYASRH